MEKVFGICNLHDGPNLGELTANRPLGSTSFLGRYALMDFALSNFSNSQIDRMGILVEKQYSSIHDHVRDGHPWIHNTKIGGIDLFSNEGVSPTERFNTDIANILANKNFFIFNDADYYVITPPFFLMSFDFHPLVKAHIESGRDITLAYIHANDADINFKNCDAIFFDDKGIINKFARITGRKKELDVSLETIVVSKYVLMHICELSKEVSSLYTLRKMVKYVAERQLLTVGGYLFEGAVKPILSFDDYFRHSMELLRYEDAEKLFLNNWPIYTTTHSTPPALYGENAVVQNSFIANGSVIKGKVFNSVISRDVIIEEGAVVKNSILFTRTRVGSGVKVNYVVTDKQAKLINESDVSGDNNKVLYVKKGVLV